MWFWIIYFVAGFLMAGIVTVVMQEDDETITTNGCIVALIMGAIWPLVILMSMGRGIGKTLEEKDESTKHD